MLDKIKLFLWKNTFIFNISTWIYKHTLFKYQNYVLSKKWKDALYAFDDVCKELWVEYWLEFGTLLWAIRDKDFISHDVDIDMGMYLKDFDEKNQKVFEKHGFKFLHSFQVDDGSRYKEQSFTFKWVPLDIFYFNQENGDKMCYTFVPEKGKTYAQTLDALWGLLTKEHRFTDEGTIPYEFKGKKVLIPKNWEEHLISCYGKKYTIKDPNYSNTITTNVRIIDGVLGNMKM